MTRDIKFRGKRVDNGEWVYGYYFKVENHYILPKNSEKVRVLPLGYTDGPPCIDGFIQVDPETVGEFTGLKDKNGKEIWESDLVQIQSQYETDEPIDSIATVHYSQASFRLNFHDMILNEKVAAGIGNWSIEVIGNIYENPELLSKEK